MHLTQLLKNRIFLFIILIGILEPRCVRELAVYKGGIWYVWRRIDLLLIYAGTILIIAASLFLLRKISLIAVAVMLYQTWWIFSDLYNGVSIYSDMRNAFQMIALVLLIDLACKLDFKVRLLDVMSFILGIFILINFITIIANPKGMYVDDRNWTANWFLGYKNLHIYVYLLYIACSALRDFLKFGRLKLRYYGMVGVMVVAALLTDSSTTTVVLVLLTLLIVFFHNAKLPKWINGATSMGVSAILSALFIFANFQSHFTSLLEILFQRDVTFSGRTSIWSAALLKIADSPILGNGNSDVSTTLFSNWDVGQCHNNFLDILFVGGFVLMALFVWIQYLTCSRMLKEKGQLAVNILTFVWIGYAVLFLMEARRNDVFIYAIYAFAYNAQYFSLKAVDVNRHVRMERVKRRKIRLVIKR